MLRKTCNISDEERTVLKTVANYRVGFSTAILSLIEHPNLDELNGLLASLVKRKLLQKQKAKDVLIRGVPLYFLTNQGAAVLNIPKDRKPPNGPRAIGNHLAILWFCAFEMERQFKRVENDVIQDVFGCSLHRNCIHVVGQVKQKATALRVYRPETDLAGKLKECNRTLATLPDSLLPAVNQGDYGLLVLEQFSSSVNQGNRTR